MLGRSVIKSSRVLCPTLLFSRSFKIGATIPNKITGLREDSPGNKVDFGELVSKGKHIIIGVPAAFSPGCSNKHIPGFVKLYPEFQKKGIQNFWITSVNDPFVTKAWKESLNIPEGMRIIADTKGEFADAGDYLFDSSRIFGNDRSKRYALYIEDGKVVKEFLEPDFTGVKNSSAENVLKNL